MDARFLFPTTEHKNKGQQKKAEALPAPAPASGAAKDGPKRPPDLKEMKCVHLLGLELVAVSFILDNL